MDQRSRLLGALGVLALTAVACFPETVRITPAPSTAAPTLAAPTATASPFTPPGFGPTFAPITPGPTPTLSAPPASPGSTPAAACPPQGGGSQTNRAVITAIRVAHNPGFDRVVFELGPNSFGTYGLPPYSIEVASGFTATSGQPVRVDGNAFFGVRLDNTDAHDQNGKVTVASTDIKTTTPLVKEVRIVEDFEAVNRWAIGLDHLVCPSVLTLAGPVRVVIDFPTPP